VLSTDTAEMTQLKLKGLNLCYSKSAVSHTSVPASTRTYTSYTQTHTQTHTINIYRC